MGNKKFLTPRELPDRVARGWVRAGAERGGSAHLRLFSPGRAAIRVRHHYLFRRQLGDNPQAHLRPGVFCRDASNMIG